MHETVFLILTTSGLVALPRDGNNNILAGQKAWSCNYQQIESVMPTQSTMRGYFAIKLNFYNKDADAKLIVNV